MTIVLQLQAKRSALGEARFQQSKFPLAARLIATTIQVCALRCL
jgi:hypothetical protein